MERLRALFRRYREPIVYLIFGVLTTLVNVGLFAILTAATSLPTAAANAIALSTSILFAYVTNRRFVFESRQTGRAAVREFLMFIGSRILPGLLDEGIVVLGVDVIGAPESISAGAWATAVKLAANVLVVIVNYIFSKLLIFRRPKDGGTTS